MDAHTHDDVDWAARLKVMRRFDELDQQAHATVAARLSNTVPRGGTIVDVGPGAGGMSAAFGAQLAAAGGGELVLIDAVEQVLREAAEAARESIGDQAAVSIRTVTADVATADIAAVTPAADLLWASGVVHHLPDQQAALRRLAGAVHSAGVLAVAEGGLETRCLPWDLGIGEPGLEQRLVGAREAWFRQLRHGMPGSVRMPFGWGRALTEVGLLSVSSFSYLVDHPAPAGPVVRDYVFDRLCWIAEIGAEWLSKDDTDTVRRLIDEKDPAYVGDRDDTYLLTSRTVHYGWRA